MKAETSARKPRFYGLVIVGITFGLFGVWAAVAPLQGAALATGMVEVKGARKSVQHLQGGIVKEILVRDGDHVNEGDLLVRLDDTEDRAQLEIARLQYFNTLALKTRLAAERDGLDTVNFPPDLVDSDDARAREAMTSQQQVFKARREAMQGEVSVLEQRIEQLGEQIKGSQGLKKGNESMARSFTEELKDFRELLEEGFADKNRLRELERNVARSESSVAENIAFIAGLEMQTGETRLEILQLTKSHQEAVNTELNTVQAQLYDLQERVRALSYSLQLTDIKAPATGTVLNLAVHTEGGVVRAGDELMAVVPQGTELIISARVNPQDIDRVANGQLADIRFTAFKSQTTPVIEGRLTHLSADAILDEKQGYSYYKAKIEVTESGYGMLADLDLLPGMPAEVLIKTGDRTLLQYLTQPMRNAFARSLIED